MKALTLVVALTSGLLAGCVAPRDIQISTQFDPRAAAYINAPGSGAIIGQAFMRQVGGGVVTAAGEPVILMPDVPYIREVITSASTGPVNFTNVDPQVRQYAKMTTADASGSFAFTGLSAGTYYILTRVQWGVPQRYGTMQQGGELLHRVSIRNGESARVILSK